MPYVAVETGFILKQYFAVEVSSPFAAIVHVFAHVGGYMARMCASASMAP